MSDTFHHGRRNIESVYGDTYRWMSNTPKWWRKLFFTQPRRAKTRMAINKITRTLSMDDDTVFPLDRKPHKYYW